MAAEGGEQVGGDGGEAQTVGAPGVDAADERVDEALEDLVSEAAADDVGDGRVRARLQLRQHHVEGGPRHAFATDHPRAGERRRV